MKASLRQKLEQIAERFIIIGEQLSDPDVIGDQTRFRELSREYARLDAVNTDFQTYESALAECESTRELVSDADPEMSALGKEELGRVEARLEVLEQALHRHLLPSDPRDDSNIFLEIRAGTGGDEAALFAGDLFRMYTRYAAESRGYRIEILSESGGEHGGYKEIITRVVGNGAYSRLKFESGVHRVQRVPLTEAQGRIHTSACTVAVLPELDEVEEIQIDESQLRIDTYRASGAGGQHVNKTDSAVRLTHLPSGIVVECQDERSQHKNRARAMSLLKAKLLDVEQERQQSEQAAQRRQLVGSGDRSERIRTYNFPQRRVTDHRINLTLYRLEEVVQGKLDLVVDPLVSEHQADLMASLNEEEPGA